MFSVWLTRQWFQRRLVPALWLLVPLSWLYRVLAGWQRGRVKPERLPVPTVVIGNLIVGGAGKTPLAIALAKALKVAGFHPGIISRGYGATADDLLAVDANSDPKMVGDEPLLIARRTGVPVYVGRRRVEAGRLLLSEHPEVNVLLCDDGLQHYRLARDVEIVVFDQRGIGNGYQLPAGPLRESMARLATVDAVVGNGLASGELPVENPFFPMHLQPGDFYALLDPLSTVAAEQLQGSGKRLFALAGIGHPERFFSTLAGMGLACETRAFADHHPYSASDLAFAKGGILLMTEKDAVKCAAIAKAADLLPEIWVLPVEADLPQPLVQLVLEKIRGCTPA